MTATLPVLVVLTSVLTGVCLRFWIVCQSVGHRYLATGFGLLGFRTSQFYTARRSVVSLDPSPTPDAPRLGGVTTFVIHRAIGIAHFVVCILGTPELLPVWITDPLRRTPGVTTRELKGHNSQNALVYYFRFTVRRKSLLPSRKNIYVLTIII